MNLTQEQFDKEIERVKKKSPNLYRFIVDYVNELVSSEELDTYLSLSPEKRAEYIAQYQPRKECTAPHNHTLY